MEHGTTGETVLWSVVTFDPSQFENLAWFLKWEEYHHKRSPNLSGFEFVTKTEHVRLCLEGL
jgi:hypothetical protein